jgi:glucose/arabinose dehydrogenase
MMRAGRGVLAGCALAIVLGACGGSSKHAATPVATTAAATPSRVASTPPAARAVEADAYRATNVLPEAGFAQMLALQVVPGDEDHAVVLAKDGVVHRVSMVDGGEEAAAFLDIRGRIIEDPGQEEGLLGLAFAPDYAASGRFYVYYSAGNPRRAVISRFVAHDGQADADSEHVLLEIGEPFPNHNGGATAFGPDGYLYLGVGDGGSQGDPQGNGQNTGVLLGKILRIDVSGADYAIPADNPFAPGGGRPEIYAYGLRNPWRISFDPVTGALWAADVGQNTWEEVDRIVKGGNYGWNVMEGNHCFKPKQGCDTDRLLAPRAEYSHDSGCSVTGGSVYRGRAMPELNGWYVYSDYCSGRVWAFDTANESSAPVQLVDTGLSIASFGVDKDGELYMVGFGGQIARLVRR